MRYGSQINRMFRRLTAAERAQLLMTDPQRASLAPVLWNTMPGMERQEVNAHIDFANRVVHVLGRQGHELRERIATLDMTCSLLLVIREWGVDRYLILSDWEQHIAEHSAPRQPANSWEVRGPSQASVMLGTAATFIDEANPWDVIARDLRRRLREGVQDAWADLLACEEIGTALQEAGPFADFIQQLLDGELARCRHLLDELLARAHALIGEIPLPGANAEMRAWLATIFSTELAGRWPTSDAGPPAIRWRVVKQGDADWHR